MDSKKKSIAEEFALKPIKKDKSQSFVRHRLSKKVKEQRKKGKND